MAYTQSEVEDRIEILLEQMEVQLCELDEANKKQAHAEITRRVAFAQARLFKRAQPYAKGEKPNADAVDDYAIVQSQEAVFEAMLATNNVVTLRESLKTKQSELSALQSLMRSFAATGPEPATRFSYLRI